MSFVRVKYRPGAVHADLVDSNVLDAHDITRHKKVAIPDDDPYGESETFRIVVPPMDPIFTQTRRKEGVVVSNEKELRKSQYPTIKQKAEITKEWMKKEAKDAKRKAKEEAYKKKWEDKLLKAQKQLNEMKAGEEALEEEDEEEVEEFEEEEEAEGTGDNDADDDILDQDAKKIRELEKEAFKKNMQLMKEKKLLKQRNSRPYYSSNGFVSRSLAFNLMLGVGKREKDCTPVLPWILIGRADSAQNLTFLIKEGVTHILNVTTEVSNFFTDKFIYYRIPILDIESADIAPYFEPAIEFIKHVQSIRGKIFIHCTAGVSRAPAIAMAYILKERPKVCLIDIYRFILARRPILNMNKKFLFNLAQLELTLGLGSSVLYQKEWRFYEFNLLRASGLEERSSKGLLRTTLYLYSPEGIRGEDDLLI